MLAIEIPDWPHKHCFRRLDRGNEFVTSFSANVSYERRFVTKQSHCLLKPPVSAAKMPRSFAVPSSLSNTKFEIEKRRCFPAYGPTKSVPSCCVSQFGPRSFHQFSIRPNSSTSNSHWR